MLTRSARQSTRTESDAFGPVQVASDRYWGAQTERSLENFKINQPQDRMPPPVIRAFGILKGAAAKVNVQYGLGNYTNDYAREQQLSAYQTPRLAKRYNKPPRKLPR